MDSRFLPIAFAAAVACASPAAAQPVSRDADAAAIRAHIESIFQAFVDKDQPKLRETHGSNWRGFQAGSRSVIRGLDAYMEAVRGSSGLPRGQGMTGYRISDFDVVFYGDTAVASFVADLDAQFGTQKLSQRLNLLDVYAKERGQWIQVASNTSYNPAFTEERMSALQPLSEVARRSLLAAREAVWRAWYAGDTVALETMLPPELMTLGPGPGGWATRDQVTAASTAFAKGGGRLTRLEFPRTEIQAYGNTAIIYTSYALDVEKDGAKHTESGLATEMFVRRDGTWLNTGWHLAPARAQE